MKWEYFGNNEARKALLDFFTKRNERLIAGNYVHYFWGNDNGEWRFLSISSNEELIGTIMQVSDSGISKEERLVVQYASYYVKNPIHVSCGTLKKPVFNNFRKAMWENGKRSYGKKWILYPRGDLVKSGDVVKLVRQGLDKP